jgi:hypothetical protein
VGGVGGSGGWCVEGLEGLAMGGGLEGLVGVEGLVGGRG